LATLLGSSHAVRGKELREQEYYYETIAMLILTVRGWVKVCHVNPEVQKSVKQSLEYFLPLLSLRQAPKKDAFL